MLSFSGSLKVFVVAPSVPDNGYIGGALGEFGLLLLKDITADEVRRARG